MGHVSEQTLKDWRELIVERAITGQPLDLGGLVEQFVSSMYNKRSEALYKYGCIHKGLLAWRKSLTTEKQRAETFMAGEKNASGTYKTAFGGVRITMMTAQEIAETGRMRAKKARVNVEAESADVRRESLPQPLTTEAELTAYVAAMVDKLGKIEMDIANVEQYIADATAYQRNRLDDLRAMSAELYEVAQTTLANLGLAR